MDTLRAMRYFVRAVELGSLSAVGREEGTTQPNVSKVLRALEEELGARLLERSTTGLAATDQGLRFYRRAKALLDDYEAAVADTRGRTGQPAGLLKINAPVGFGEFCLNAIVQRFMAAFPAVDIELILDDRYVDLVEEGADLALRLGRRLPNNVVARRIGSSARHLYAAPAYLERRGEPAGPENLAAHDYIRFAWATDGGRIELGDGTRSVAVDTRGRYRVNSAMAIRESVAMASGVGLCPAWLVSDLVGSGQLVRVLPGWSAPPQELFLLYPSRRHLPARVRMFADFLGREVEALPGFD